jgi:hypothetical protein
MKGRRRGNESGAADYINVGRAHVGLYLGQNGLGRAGQRGGPKRPLNS